MAKRANRVRRLTEKTFPTWTERQRNKTLLVGVVSASCAESAPLTEFLEDMGGSRSTRFGVGLIDFDESRGLARQYQVDAVPSLLLFRGGRLVDQLIRVCT
jgi:thioredoxin 1